MIQAVNLLADCLYVKLSGILLSSNFGGAKDERLVGHS